MAIDRRGSFTPPPSFSSRTSYAPKSCMSENRKNYYSRSSTTPSPSSDRFHIVYKVPSGDSPYVRAKRVQLIDKDPIRSISLFWRAINSGDRVDSAVKDMAVVMKQLDRSDEAIEAIRSFRHLCSREAQESLDNILIELYKRSGRLEEQIEILMEKVKRIEEEESIGGRRTKMARSQGKKVHITVEQEYSRLLGNLAWAHLQQNNYKLAEEYYRKGLSIELDRNKQCNLAICLMHMNRIKEARLLLQSIKASAADKPMDESYAKSYERAHEMLDQIAAQGGLQSFLKDKENHSEQQERDFDCQSQLDYIDTTPVVSKWKTGACTDSRQEASERRLYTQPINRTRRKETQTAIPLSVKRYLSSPNDESEVKLEESNTGSLNECNTEEEKKRESGLLGRGPNEKVEEANKNSFFPSWSCKSGKSWADMVEEDEQEDSMDLGAQLLSSKSSSARRSLAFDHDKRDTEICASSPPKPNGSWLSHRKNEGTLNSGRLSVFQDITPATESHCAK